MEHYLFLSGTSVNTYEVDSEHHVENHVGSAFTEEELKEYMHVGVMVIIRCSHPLGLTAGTIGTKDQHYAVSGPCISFIMMS